MRIEYCYYTESPDGEYSYVEDEKKLDKRLVKAAVKFVLSPGSPKEITDLILPDTIYGYSVHQLEIQLELSENSPFFTNGIPPVKRIEISSSIQFLKLKPLFNNMRYNYLNSCTVEASPDNPYFRVSDHGLYTKERPHMLIAIFSPGERFIVPDGIKRICAGAGCALTRLRELTVPESVREIGVSAFENCTSLEKIDISCGIIKQRAFRGCVLLHTVLLNGVSNISRDSFKNCPNDLNVLMSNSFDACHGLRRLGCTVKDGANELELDCKEIRDYSFNRAFWHSGLLKKLTLIGTDEICREAFKECSILTYASLDCKKIGEEAFDNCKALETVSLFNTEEIGVNAFNGCKALKEIKLPNTLRVIKNRAFCNTGIRHLVIPPNVDEIGDFIISGGTLEVHLKNGKLPFKHDTYPADIGTLLVVRSPQTDKIICQFVLLESPDDVVLTENGADFTKYDERLKNPDPDFDYDSDLTSRAARVRLHDPAGMSAETFAFFKDIVSRNTAFDVSLKISSERCTASDIAEYPYLDDIDNERFLSLINYSAEKGKPEITAVLMQKMHERRSRE